MNEARDDMLLGDRYRLMKRIGVGGMASVYLGEDERLRRRVAIKRLHPERVGEAVLRFRREAMLAANLSHPGLVTVYDAFEEDGQFIVVMEFIDGQDLSKALDGGPPPQERALRILRGVAGALDHVHGAGIVHRDVKPSNILLEAGGERAKLTDLGIARVMEDTSTTQANVVPGSVPYMSPEQLRGQTVGKPSDIYAFALVAFEVLSGKRVQEGTPEQITRQALDETAPDIREVRPDTPDGAAEALRRGLAREPEQRPGSAGEFVEDLERGLDGARATTARVEPVAVAPVAPEPSTAEAAAPAPAPAAAAPLRPSRPASREAPRTSGGRGRRWLPLALLAVAALVVGLVVILGGGGDEDPPSGGGSTTTSAGSGGGGAKESAPVVAAPEQAVQDFYEAAAADDFETVEALASPAIEDLLGGSEGIAGTFSTLQSVEFTEVSTLSESSDSAEVELATVATHSDRTEECAGTVSLILEGEAWLVDDLGITCDVVG